MDDDTAVQAFKRTVWEYYQTRGRHDLPWRRPGPGGHFDPYKILVSELMLQQTQVGRVIPKYEAFLSEFPAVADLAAAPPGEVLRAWSGLGYNRRAKFLWQTARRIIDDYGGRFPESAAELAKLPGIGPNTAGAIAAYAFNRPATFMETNVRTVFIHHFFHDQTDIPDKPIGELVARTLDTERPRQWYWALTDYGAYLKRTAGNPSRRSRAYAKQSKFEGSRRQLRGQIIRLLADRAYSEADLRSAIADERLPGVLQDLLTEKLIARHGRSFRL